MSRFLITLDQNWHKYNVYAKNTGVDVYYDNGKILSTTDTGYNSGYIGLGTGALYNGISAYYDDLRIRKYTANEPTHETWKSEIVADSAQTIVPPFVSATNLNNYSYVKNHTINGSTDGVLSDFQVKFVVHSDSGVDNCQNVYLNGHSLSWPNDIRFTNINDTLLSYWIESSNSSTATVWIKVDSIPSSGTVIKLYYGCDEDSGASDGPSTFLLFDDFNNNGIDTDKWYGVISSGGSSTVTETNGQLKATGDGTNKAQLRSKNVISAPYVLDVKVKNVNALSIDNHWNGLLDVNKDPSSGYQTCYASWANPKNLFLAKRNPGSALSGYNIVLDQNWHNYSVRAKSSGLTIFFDNAQILTTTDTGYTTGYFGLGMTSNTNGVSAYYDDLRLRKFAANEPAHGDWGAEMTPTAPVPTPDPYQLDTDGDGLPDYVEERGFIDDKMVRHFTNKSCADTDGDWLNDSEEVVYASIAEYNSGNYRVISYPDVPDSDNDVLDDYEECEYYNTDPLCQYSDTDLLNDSLEISIGTDPLNRDTDEDSFDDFFEYCYREGSGNTVLFNPIVKDLSIEERKTEFCLGYVFGEWLMSDHDNMYYLGGYLSAGATPGWGDVTDFSDLFASIYHLDQYSFILNVIAVLIDLGSYAAALGIVIPGIGVITFAGAYGTNLISSVMGRLAKCYLKHPKLIGPILTIAMDLLKDTSAYDQIAWIKYILDTDRVVIDSLLDVHHVPENTLLDWCKKGVDIKHANELMNNGATIDEIQYVINQLHIKSLDHCFTDVLFTASKNNQIVWLQNGNGFGLTHIEKHHDDLYTKFGIQTRSELISKIKETIVASDIIKFTKSNGKGEILYFKEFTDNNGNQKYLRIVVSNEPPEEGIGKGNIVTAHIIELRDI